MISSWLLIAMLSSYAIAVVAIYRSTSRVSISHALCDEVVWVECMLSMLALGMFTLCYESHRPVQSKTLMISMVLVIAGIIGLLTFPVVEDPKCHYLCAAITFVSILVWMCALYTLHKSATGLVVLQIVLFFSIIYCTLCTEKSIFWLECAYLLVFALYFLYHHYYYVDC